MKKVVGIKAYTYDRFGRQLSAAATFNGSGTVTMAADTYNSIGQLSRSVYDGLAAEYSYNTVGLPQCVTFDNGRRIDYRYDAAGRKLAATLRRKSLSSGGTVLPGRPGITLEPDPGGTIIVDPGTKPGIGTISGSVTLDSRDYIGNYELSGDTLLRVNTPYGYFDGTDYYTYLRDYQGNIRCVVRPAGRTDFEMVQQNHYYPYGLPVSCSTSPDANPYKYGSKHLDTRHGLNLYDFEARFHAPDLGRFLSPDPHASDYHDLSPYIFCAANPIKYIDPDGKVLKYPADGVFNMRLADIKDYIGAPYKQAISAMKESAITFNIIDGAKSGEHFNIHTKYIGSGDNRKIVSVDIHIDTTVALELENGEIMSSAMCTLHEFGHGEEIANDEIRFLDNNETKDEQYDTKEERRNITEVENPAAETLGEPVRNSHSYYRYIDNNNDPTKHHKK